MKQSPLMAAIKRANNPKVHKLPKEKKSKGMRVPSGSDYYWPPTLYLSTEDFPGVENWKAGDVVNLAITATVKSKSENQEAGSKEQVSCDLKVTAISDLGVKK